MENINEKKRRGRKSKTQDISANNLESNIIIDKVPKKRGRKPKGGKVIACIEEEPNEIENTPNIILHLKCNKNDLDNIYSNNSVDTFQFNTGKTYDFNYLQLSNYKTNTINNNSTNSFDTNISNENKIIWQKLEKLSNSLHLETSCDKKSSCFFCTCDFDNMPIHIPKYQLKETFYVYGCFCSPECACAFLMNDKSIDNTSKFERYYLLNYIYCKIYNYEKNIKPAPSPYYLLDKYYGNLSIQEYRKLLKSERLLLVVDKPLVRTMPELHDDNDDYLLNNKGVPTTISKYVPQRETKINNKNDIVNQNFNLNK